LNPDALLFPDSLPAMVDQLASDPTIGVLGPRIELPDGRLERSWGSNPTLREEWRRRREGITAAPAEAVACSPDWVTGGCCLIRRAAWDLVHGFDEGYFLYFEDLDLCRRIRSAGYQVRYWPMVTAFHQRGASAHQLGLDTERHYRAGQLRYYRTYGGFEAQLGLRAYLAAKYLWRYWRFPRDRGLCRAVLRLVIGS